MARYLRLRALKASRLRHHTHRGGGRMTFSGEAMRTFISLRDHRLMLRVNRWPAPRWIRVWMICATRGGDGWLWYALGADAPAVRRRAALHGRGTAGTGGRHRHRHLSQAQENGAASGPPSSRIVGPRCCRPTSSRFPSGHTITAFAVSVSLAAFYPDLAIGLLFCAVSIAASRILLGMHFLSDVLAGAAIGALLAYGASHLVRLL
jgi:undecaprenyl-diphosphatase